MSHLANLRVSRVVWVRATAHAAGGAPTTSDDNLPVQSARAQARAHPVPALARQPDLRGRLGDDLAVLQEIRLPS